VSKRIVVVDDDRLVLRSVSDALEASGYEVWATDSTEEALALTEEVEPDVLVTDYRMPGMDGVSLLERVKGLAAVPLMLVYSAAPRPRDEPLPRLGEVDWVAKAPGHSALLERLSGLLDGAVDAR
jgi:CheY-like chemotaxis protein